MRFDRRRLELRRSRTETFGLLRRSLGRGGRLRVGEAIRDAGKRNPFAGAGGEH